VHGQASLADEDFARDVEDNELSHHIRP
jgi:hypothetical protein